MNELLQINTDFFFEIFFIFLGIGAGFVISEYKEHRSSKKNLKNIRELILNDVSRIKDLRLQEPACTIKRNRTSELYYAGKFIESKGNLDLLTNYHKRFDFSFWKGMLQTGTPIEFGRDFFYNYMSFYQQVEHRVNSMEIEFEKTKQNITRIFNDHYERNLLEESIRDKHKEIRKIVDDELGISEKTRENKELKKLIAKNKELEELIADELYFYYAKIYANFYAIERLADKLPNATKEKLDHAIKSTTSYMKWNDLCTDLYVEGLDKYQK